MEKQKIYRNVYFLKNIIEKGKGNMNILYYGQLYSNARNIKDFNKIYDKNQDLVVSCTSCFLNKLGVVKKVKKP